MRVAGFSYNGREWMANFVVSGFIGVITFVVYANMTRFSWAYPSGAMLKARPVWPGQSFPARLAEDGRSLPWA